MEMMTLDFMRPKRSITKWPFAIAEPLFFGMAPVLLNVFGGQIGIGIMIDIPPSVMDSWPTPNYTNPETRGAALPISVLVLYFLTVLVLTVRLYGKIEISHSFRADDSLIVVAMVMTTGVTIAVLLSKWEYQLDRHAWDLPPRFYQPSNVLAIINSVLFCLASTFVRLSFLALYLHLIAHVKPRWYKWTVYFAMFLTIAVAVAYTLALIFRCSPIKASYDYGPPSFRPSYQHHCGNREKILYTGSLIMTILDLLVVVIPGPLSWKLNQPLRVRIGVLGMFLLGLLICVCGALKTKFIHILFNTYDEPWVSCPIWILSAVELHVGILCSSVPAIRIVAREYRQLYRGWVHNKAQRNESTTNLTYFESSASHVSSNAGSSFIDEHVLERPQKSFFGNNDTRWLSYTEGWSSIDSNKRSQ